jgi:hypothetical protein
MSRFLLPASFAAALAIGAVLWAAPGHAQSLTCRSVNGNTVCAGPGATSCQTTNGRTICAQGAVPCLTGRGRDGCPEVPPGARQSDDMSDDDQDSYDDDDAVDLLARPSGPSPGRRL